MKPKSTRNLIEEQLKPQLIEIINLNHPLCKLTHMIDWRRIEESFSMAYSHTGRSGKSIRLMVGLHYLKHTYDESDESVVYHWLENPYWQYFTGETVFQDELPIDPSSMTNFRKRIGDHKLLELLEETIRMGFKSGYLKKTDVKRVNVDTTVQEKNVAFPTDIRIYFREIEYLNRFAISNGIKLKQTYLRTGKKLLQKCAGYTHARQFKRAAKSTKKMQTNMGRLYRDIERKSTSSMKSSDEFIKLKKFYLNLKDRSRTSKNKLYSLHAPEVECISKGKQHKRYEFGNKVGVVSTSKKNFVLSCMGFHGNPYDGHTLDANLKQAETLLGDLGHIQKAFVDLGYRKHNYEGDAEVHIVPKSLKKFKPSFRKWLKRRSAVEAGIGHMKRDNRMGRNFLLGEDGDRINAILSGCGHNLRMLLAFLLWLKIRIGKIATEIQKIFQNQLTGLILKTVFQG